MSQFKRRGAFQILFVLLFSLIVHQTALAEISKQTLEPLMTLPSADAGGNSLSAIRKIWSDKITDKSKDGFDSGGTSIPPVMNATFQDGQNKIFVSVYLPGCQSLQRALSDKNSVASDCPLRIAVVRDGDAKIIDRVENFVLATPTNKLGEAVMSSNRNRTSFVYNNETHVLSVLQIIDGKLANVNAHQFHLEY